jgi:hypothetical protein
MRQLEHIEGVNLMRWVRLSTSRFPELQRIYHIPNGGDRHRAVAAKMKAEGVRKGVLDYCLPVARGGYHGLYIELKAGKGRPTVEQKAELEMLQADGYCAEVCTGWQACADLIAEYLEQPPTKVEGASNGRP